MVQMNQFASINKDTVVVNKCMDTKVGKQRGPMTVRGEMAVMVG